MRHLCRAPECYQAILLTSHLPFSAQTAGLFPNSDVVTLSQNEVFTVTGFNCLGFFLFFILQQRYRDRHFTLLGIKTS